jgi:hypothetical protein
MNTRTIKLMDCVHGTSTNNDGFELFIKISKVFDAGDILKLSLEGSTSMSSSFLNSSFGELVDRYGMDTIKRQLRLVNFKPSQAEEIKKYLEIMTHHA